MNENFLKQIYEFITYHPAEDSQFLLLNEVTYLEQDKLNADLFCLKLFILDLVLADKMSDLEKRDKIMDLVMKHSLKVEGLKVSDIHKITKNISKKIEFFAKYSSIQLHESLIDAPQNVGIAYGISVGQKEEDYIKIAAYFSHHFVLFYNFIDSIVSYHIINE